MISIASVGIMPGPLTSVIANNEIYVNKTLGIGFRIPKNWHFYDVMQMNEMYNSQIVKPDAAYFDELLEELKNQPLVSIGMYPFENEGEKVFSPSITLRLEENDGSVDLEDLLDCSSDYLETIVKGFKQLGVSTIEEICGYRAVQGKYSYLFEAENMSPTSIIGRSCIIERESQFYSFNMYNFNPEDKDINLMFDQLVLSILIL